MKIEEALDILEYPEDGSSEYKRDKALYLIKRRIAQLEESLADANQEIENWKLSY